MRLTATEAPAYMETPGATIRGTDWGGMRCVHIELGPGTDLGPLLKGLPDDHCQCPHWGYVLKGSITIGYTDGQEEVIGAGELFYWPPGHTPKTDEGVTFIEFSPDRELQTVYDHIGIGSRPQG
jgi:mannose-6-phosphate isomerase-like protein (cupin superfamily)